MASTASNKKSGGIVLQRSRVTLIIYRIPSESLESSSNFQGENTSKINRLYQGKPIFTPFITSLLLVSSQLCG